MSLVYSIVYNSLSITYFNSDHYCDDDNNNNNTN